MSCVAGVLHCGTCLQTRSAEGRMYDGQTNHHNELKVRCAIKVYL